MEFKVKRHDRGEGSEKDEKKNGKLGKDTSAKQAGDAAPDEPEKDKSHGEEQDSEEEAQHRAGKDMLDAIESGDPKAVFAAHRHLHHVHMTTSAEAGGDDPDGANPHKNSGLVAAIKGMPLKTGV